MLRLKRDSIHSSQLSNAESTEWETDALANEATKAGWRIFFCYTEILKHPSLTHHGTTPIPLKSTHPT